MPVVVLGLVDKDLKITVDAAVGITSRPRVDRLLLLPSSPVFLQWCCERSLVVEGHVPWRFYQPSLG